MENVVSFAGMSAGTVCSLMDRISDCSAAITLSCVGSGTGHPNGCLNSYEGSTEFELRPKDSLDTDVSSLEPITVCRGFSDVMPTVQLILSELFRATLQTK